MKFQFDLSDEKPPQNFLQSSERSFFVKRWKEFQIVHLTDPQFESLDTLNLLRDWTGYCEPYGCEFLGTLAGEMMGQIQLRNNFAIEVIRQEILKYFHRKSDHLQVSLHQAQNLK